ncbi:XRE family transcriptional regulator [Paenibacillus mucilaginosus]|nr:helix-turn-helix transcriptional regulator [Paenibacillus mucilaginosus]WFA18244.1 XRE family transcriptional regulator [Paenibacillus mucilaginosus]
MRGGSNLLNIDRHHELGSFLRKRRERISPEEIGIPRGSRRRTPGLRRGEVAMLAGMSLEWYTYLEQGRAIQVSSEVLGSLARVLHLSPNERRHLFTLAHLHDPTEVKQPLPAVSPILQSLLDQLETTPAYILDQRMNIVGWNEAFSDVYGDYLYKGERQRNLVWITFASPEFRKLKGEHWEEAAVHCLAQFRAGYGQHVGDAWWQEQITELSMSSPIFKEMWDRQDVLYAPDGHKIIYHPLMGKMSFEYLAFQVMDSPELQMVLHMPAKGTDTAEKLKRLSRKT